MTNHLLTLHDYPNTDEVFGDTVYVMGGICYYVYDKRYNGKCNIVQHRNNSQHVSSRFMLEENCDLFIRDAIASNIISRIFKEDITTIDKYISATVPFGIPTNDKGNISRESQDDLVLYMTGNEFKGGGTGFIPRCDVMKNEEYIDKHKVFINTASDNMLRFPYDVLYKPFYGAPGTICNGSYIMLGPLKQKEYCDNIISYLSTKFVRMMVLQRKADQHVYASTFKYVPLQDFSHPWTDEMLYKKYNLTDEEIEYIEKTIKPMI